MAPFIARAILWLIFAIILFDIIKESNRLFDLSINPYFAIVPAVLNFLFGEYIFKKWKFNQKAKINKSAESWIEKILVFIGFILIGSLILFVFIVWALQIYSQIVSQDKYTVSGEVKLQESTGEIYVWLKTRDELEKWGEPAPPARSLMIKPSPQELKAKKVIFKFIEVPRRFYGIFCFQDLNKNGKMDYIDGSLGERRSAEPYGCSGPNFLGPCQWSNIKFKVDKDIIGIEIELQLPLK
jgi:heme/copper-type cytochrome/quinol oxidase subunit 2